MLFNLLSDSYILTEAVQGLRERVQHFRSTAARRKRFPFGGGVNKDDLELAKVGFKNVNLVVLVPCFMKWMVPLPVCFFSSLG